MVKINKEQKRNIGIAITIIAIIIILAVFTRFALPISVNFPGFTSATTTIFGETNKYIGFSMDWEWEGIRTRSSGANIGQNITIESGIIKDKRARFEIPEKDRISPFLGNENYPLQEGIWFEATQVFDPINLIINPDSANEITRSTQIDSKTECRITNLCKTLLPSDTFCEDTNSYISLLECRFTGVYTCQEPEGCKLEGPYGGKINVKIFKKGIEKEITVYRIINNQCSLITIKESERTDFDFDTFNECQDNIMIPKKINIYRLINNECIFMTIDENEKTSLDFDTIEECQEKIETPEPKVTTNIFIIILILAIILVVIFIFIKLRKR